MTKLRSLLGYDLFRDAEDTDEQRVEGMEKAMRTGSAAGTSAAQSTGDPFLELPDELSIFPPSDEVVNDLVDVYFRFLQDSVFNFLHEGVFKSRMQETTLPQCLIYAVCAASVRFIASITLSNSHYQISRS